LSVVEQKLQALAGEEVCVLMSGGLDSCVLAWLVSKYARGIHPVYIRTGLLWEAAECHWLERFFSALASPKIQPACILDLPVSDVYRQHWSLTGQAIPDHRSADGEVYLPGRNLLLLSKATLFCAMNQIPSLAVGTLKGNPFPDATHEFFCQFAAVASLALSFPLKVHTPFSDLSKVEVIELGGDLPLHLSFSCIDPVGLEHCGCCNKCAERRRSFQAAGMSDQTQYRSLPVLSQFAPS
jgi:7-cyano-7-deazaguanine synthase